MKTWIYRWGPAILVMAIIFLASSTQGTSLPKFGFWDYFIKKGGHMLGYALLAASFCHALRGAKRAARHPFVWAVCLTVLYAASDEWHQKFTAGRTAALLDVGIDAMGGLIGIAVMRWAYSRLPAPETARLSPNP